MHLIEERGYLEPRKYVLVFSGIIVWVTHEAFIRNSALGTAIIMPPLKNHLSLYWACSLMSHPSSLTTLLSITTCLK
jgi:hypothetical protein